MKLDDLSTKHLMQYAAQKIFKVTWYFLSLIIVVDVFLCYASLCFIMKYTTAVKIMAAVTALVTATNLHSTMTMITKT